VTADLAWLRKTGLADVVAGRALAGGQVLGICGGLQMLGERLHDPEGVDGEATGLGLLPVTTEYSREKLTRPVTVRFAELPAAWAALSGLTFAGYEIRHGETTSTGPASEALEEGRGYADGPVLGITAHGLLEDAAVLRALLGAAPGRSLDQVFDGLADAVEEHLDTALLKSLAGVA